MDDGPVDRASATLGWFVGVWVVMMAAMMFPSVSPTVALYSRMTRSASLRSRRCSSRPAISRRGPAVGVLAFVVAVAGGRIAGDALCLGPRGPLGRRRDAARRGASTS